MANEDRRTNLTQIVHETIIDAPLTILQLPRIFVLKVPAGATSFSALNIERVELLNVGPVVIIDITNGQEGQRICVLGDGFTRFAFNARIKHNLGVGNKLLAANKVYCFTYFNSKWIEDA